MTVIVIADTDIEALIKSYKIGYEHGIGWRAEWDYPPGGPYVYSGDNEDKLRQSKAEWTAWVIGFRQAIKLNPNIKPGHNALHR